MSEPQTAQIQIRVCVSNFIGSSQLLEECSQLGCHFSQISLVEIMAIPLTNLIESILHLEVVTVFSLHLDITCMYTYYKHVSIIIYQHLPKGAV